MFTYQYNQPDEYRFSLDSIYFARFIAEKLQSRQNLESLRVLDLCAGCGVIGIELSWHVRELRHFDFIEIQDIYADYFYQNVALVNRPELELRWHNLNYDVLLDKTWEHKFDLIISNPPYFLPHQSMLSPSEFKNRCRFFLDSSYENFLRAIINSLASGGEAYFLQRPLQQHGCDLLADSYGLLQEMGAVMQKVSHIRGTDIVLLQKSAYQE